MGNRKSCPTAECGGFRSAQLEYSPKRPAFLKNQAARSIQVDAYENDEKESAN